MQHSDLYKKNFAAVVLSPEFRIQQKRVLQYVNRKTQRHCMFLRSRKISNNSTSDHACVQLNICSTSSRVATANFSQRNNVIEPSVVPQAEDNVSTITNPTKEITKKSRQEQFLLGFIKWKELKKERVEKAREENKKRPPFKPAGRATNSQLRQALKPEPKSKQSKHYSHPNSITKMQEAFYKIVSTPPKNKNMEAKLKNIPPARKTLVKLHFIGANSKGASTSSMPRHSFKSTSTSDRRIKGPIRYTSPSNINPAKLKIKGNTLFRETEKSHETKTPVNVTNVNTYPEFVTSTKVKSRMMPQKVTEIALSPVEKWSSPHAIESLANCALLHVDQTAGKTKTNFKCLPDSIIPLQSEMMDKIGKPSLGLKANTSNIFKNCELLNMPLPGPSQQESSSMVAPHTSGNISYDRRRILKTADYPKGKPNKFGLTNLNAKENKLSSLQNLTDARKGLFKVHLTRANARAATGNSITTETSKSTSKSNRLVKERIVSTASSLKPANIKLEKNTLFTGIDAIKTPISIRNLNPYEEFITSTRTKSIPQIISGFDISPIHAPKKQLSKVNKAKVRIITGKRYNKPSDNLKQLLLELHAKRRKLHAALLTPKNKVLNRETVDNDVTLTPYLKKPLKLRGHDSKSSSNGNFVF